MTCGRVQSALFGPYNEIVNIAVTEAHARDSDRLRLLALQLNGLLGRVHVVQSPRAELSIVADADQIVGVLWADHLDTVDRMLY